MFIYIKKINLCLRTTNQNTVKMFFMTKICCLKFEKKKKKITLTTLLVWKHLDDVNKIKTSNMMGHVDESLCNNFLTCGSFFLAKKKKTKNLKINGCHNTVCRLEDILEFIYNINTCNLYDHEVIYSFWLFHQSIYILIWMFGSACTHLN